MQKVHLLSKLTIALGIIAFVCIVLSHLALLDIYQNKEPNLTNEWLMVLISPVVMILFVGVALLTQFRYLKSR